MRVLGEIVCSLLDLNVHLFMVSLSFRILITGSSSGLVETITDAVSIHSIKKAEYAKRLASGRLGHVTLLDHFIAVRFWYPCLSFILTISLIDIWRPIVCQIREGTEEFREIVGR